MIIAGYKRQPYLQKISNSIINFKIMCHLFTILWLIKYLLPHLLKGIIQTSFIYQITLYLVKHIPIELETQFMVIEKELNTLDK